MYHILFIHSSFAGHLGCFSLLVIMSNAAVNIHVRFFAWTCVLIFLGYQNGIAGSHANSLFIVWRKRQTVFRVAAPCYCSHPGGCEGGITLWFCISLRLMMSSIFSGASWPFVYLLWRNVYSRSFYYGSITVPYIFLYI